MSTNEKLWHYIDVIARKVSTDLAMNIDRQVQESDLKILGLDCIETDTIKGGILSTAIVLQIESLLEHNKELGELTIKSVTAE